MSLEVVPIDQVPHLPGFVYAVKFICGTITGRDPNDPLLPGRYETAINILNPGDQDVKFSKQAIVTLRQGEPQLEPGRAEDTSLASHHGFEVDCADVRSLLPEGVSTRAFIKGFVLIKSQGVLSVVAVYTSTI